MVYEPITNTTKREELTTGAATTVLNPGIYESYITTGGTVGDEDITIGDGTGIVVGQRKLITLAVLSAVDVLVMDFANIVALDGVALQLVELDAAGEFILLEWNGVKWQAIWADATLTDA